MKTKSILTALYVWGLQLLLVLTATGAPTYVRALRAFKRWDSVWYQAIADYGYWRALPYVTPYGGAQTVAWFPGYPLVGRFVGWSLGPLIGNDTQLALMITAALFSLVFWLYVAAIFEHLDLRWPFKLLALALIAVHPSAFFMFSQYSESMFLAAVLGFCYWSTQRRPGLNGWVGDLLTAVHGFATSATRLIGIPLAVLPLAIAVLWRERDPRKLARAAAVAALSAAGGIAFFVFLEVRFGNWHLYMDTQTTNWGVRPDYWALINPSSYALCTINLSDSGCLSQTSVPLTLGLLFVASGFFVRLVRRKKPGTRMAFALLSSAVICFAVSVAGLATRGMISMIRYTFPPYALGILAICVCASEFKLPQPLRIVAYLLLFVAAWMLLDTQLLLIRRFVGWGWVA